MGAYLTAVARESGILGRWAARSPLVILPGSDRTSALALAQRMRSAIEVAQMPMPDGAHVTISLSVAALPPGNVDAWSWDRLLQRADRAMYRGRKEGRYRHRLGRGQRTMWLPRAKPHFLLIHRPSRRMVIPDPISPLIVKMMIDRLAVTA